MLKLSPPENERKVLVHSCCAPCSSAIIECILHNDIRPVVLYYNPNIYPLEEYEKRKNEIARYLQHLNIQQIDADYNHEQWLEEIKGQEEEPERGARCLTCFLDRLKVTASYAQKLGFKIFTTTLASSRWKDLDQIFEAGRQAASLYPDTIFWNQNWRKGGLSERRNELIKELQFYNQSYCGCEFSKINNSYSACTIYNNNQRPDN